MITESLQLDKLTFEVRRSPRRRTLELMVDRGGALRVYAPNEVASDELIRWISRKLLWVHGKLAAKAQVAPQTKSPEFVSGESFSYLGRGFRLKVVKEQGKALNFDGARFLLRRDSRAKGLALFRQWYCRMGTEWLRSRVGMLAPRVGSMPADIRVRDLGFRWASCNGNGIVSFHWKLLQLPVRLVDYIIVHELTHIAHPHHDKDFWACVERAMPNWRERKEQLAEYATRYLSFGA
jgi:hypothetical protein